MKLGSWVASYDAETYEESQEFETRDEAVEFGCEAFESSFFVGEVGITNEELIDLEYKKGDLE